MDQHAAGAASVRAVATEGQFSMPYRIAQMIGFLSVTLWASSYGIAARAWSHGQVRRATAQFFRVGRLGLAALSLVAVGVLWMRGVLAWMLPTYATAISELLPGLLGMFIGYALLAFFSSLSDLWETPRKGAALWGTVVAVQIAGVVAGNAGVLGAAGIGAQRWMLTVSAIGIGAALLLVAPWLFCWRPRFSATGVPLMILGGCAVTFFSPGWVVDWIAGPAVIGAVVLLFSMGLLLRPMDRRALLRWRGRAQGGGILPQPASLKEQ